VAANQAPEAAGFERTREAGAAFSGGDSKLEAAGVQLANPLATTAQTAESAASRPK